MAGGASRRRVLLLAVAVGLAIGLAFGLVDTYIDVYLLGEGPLSANAREPLEVWLRAVVTLMSVVGAVLYARVLLAKEDVTIAAQRYRTLAEAARDDIFVIDPELRIAYVNSQGAQDFGSRPEELVGKHLSDLFRGEALERAEADLLEAFDGAETYSEMEFPFPGGSRWLSTRLVPLRRRSGRIGSVLGIARDITAARREIGLSNALSRIGDVVHARLSFDTILQAVVAEATGAAGADSSMVLTCDDKGWTVRFVHGYPEDLVGTRLSHRQAAAAEMAISTRTPVRVDDAALDARLDRESVERFGIRSMLVVPLFTGRGVVGVLLFSHREKRVRFTPEVVDFAARVGTTVSLAIENARLYEEKSNVADTLQMAILKLPDVLAGIDFAHAYRSATEAVRVGGDFYDLFEIEHDRVGITIGDISGHGIDAAVLTSLVKSGIRVEATQEGRPPDEVVASASRLLYEDSRPEIFATVFFGVLGLADGLLSYCNAGHTTGCICPAVGGVRRLPANSPFAGAFPQQRFAMSTERIGPDDLLFLYTDGLTEARRDGELFGEERLVDLLSRTRDGSARDLVGVVVAELMSFSGNTLRDDLAILALKRVEEGAEGPARPAGA